MAKQFQLSALPRAESGKNAVKKVRARGYVPAVIYGGNEAPSNLEINRREIDKILAHAVGENFLVELRVGQQEKTRLSLIQEIQHHPVRGDVLHVDFQAISATESIQAEVSVEAIGEAQGVKTNGGLLEQSLRLLLVECLPQNLPEVIQMDVSALEVGAAYHVRDLVLPKGVRVITDAELTVFRVAEPTIALEAVPAEEQLTAPEVIKEKKPEASAGQEPSKK